MSQTVGVMQVIAWFQFVALAGLFISLSFSPGSCLGMTLAGRSMLAFMFLSIFLSTLLSVLCVFGLKTAGGEHGTL